MTNELVKPKTRKKRRSWPEKHKQKLAVAAYRRKLWEHSTGPRSPEGKASSAHNAYTHGFRSRDIEEIRAFFRAQKAVIKGILAASPHPKPPL